MNKRIMLLSSFLVVNMCSIAQLTKIDTDRPDQTESAFTIPKKYIQIEAGFVAEKQDSYVTNFTLPTILTKYGISKNTELRLITQQEGNNSKLYIQNSSEVITPIQLGFKTRLIKANGIVPQTALIVHAALQNITNYGLMGSSSSNKMGINYRFTFQNSITDKIALGYNIGMEWETLDAPPSYVYTIAPGIDLSDKWYMYVEAFGSIYKNEPPINNFDFGFAYYVNENFKLDLSGGPGLSKNAPRGYINIGASYRFKITKK